MAGSNGAQASEMAVTPEEHRFLVRFFRRQMAPWAGLLAVFALACAALFSGSDPGGAAEVEARTAAALAQLRTENQELRKQLDALSTRLQAQNAGSSAADELERRVEDAKQSVRLIESRVSAALERRLQDLEASAAAPPAHAAAPPSDVTAWDVSTILDRLYALEMRTESLESNLGNAAPDPSY